MSIIVGIDAGGSATECAIERNGALSHASGEPANVRTLGAQAAAARLTAALRSTLGEERPDAIVVGAAGAGDPHLAQALEQSLRSIFTGARVAVHDDAAIALRAAVPGGDGIVLIAGTGSIACGIFGERVVRAGGYGALVGDEGSGFAIGRASIALALRAMDGRAPRDAFTDAIAAQLGAANTYEALAALYAQGEPIAAIASFARTAIERANDGDRSASKIVQAAAVELAELVKAVVRRADAAGREVPLVFSGGLLAENSLLTYLIETRLSADLPLLAPVKGAPAAVFGALTLARRLALD